jgi:predicted ATPase
MMPLLGTLLAQTEAQTGSSDDALATLRAELAAIDRTGERWFEAEMHRCHGEPLLHRKSPDTEAAEAALKMAIEVARVQQARAFEIRAALALAKLYEATGRDKIACELLGPAVAGFSEGSELPEVTEANRLLISLEQTFGRL